MFVRFWQLTCPAFVSDRQHLLCAVYLVGVNTGAAGLFYYDKKCAGKPHLLLGPLFTTQPKLSNPLASDLT